MFIYFRANILHFTICKQSVWTYTKFSEYTIKRTKTYVMYYILYKSIKMGNNSPETSNVNAKENKEYFTHIG